MIALWMLYATGLGALLGCVALALDGLAAARRSATRWWWAAAIVATLVAPTVLALRHRAAPGAPAPAPGAVAATAGRGGVAVATAAGPGGTAARRLDLARLDEPLLVVWGAASASLILLLAGVVLVQRRRARHWPAQLLDGRPVLVAPEEGPLVWGWWRLTIVVPRWALARPEDERRLMLAHEDEHRRSRDPNLLLLGALAATLAPWNAGLWWLARRLRLAIETDCDRRVLRAGADVRGYGALLLEVGSRAGRRPVPAGAAFSETASSLERRLVAMTAAPPRHPTARTLALGALAGVSLAIACSAPRPAPLRPAADAQVAAFPTLASQIGRRTVDPEPTRDQMAAAIGRYFPEVLRGDTSGGLPIRFVLDAQGGVVATSRGHSSGVPFGRLAYGVLDSVPFGYYGPSPLRTEVLWLKPDSMADSAPGYGFVTRTFGHPDTAAARRPGPSFDDDVRSWLGERPGLLPRLGAADTAFVWFVLDAQRRPLSAGVAAGMREMPRAAGVEGVVGWAGYREIFKPGVLAAGTVVAVAWSHL